MRQQAGAAAAAMSSTRLIVSDTPLTATEPL
jgi:hypothetical protein